MAVSGDRLEVKLPSRKVGVHAAEHVRQCPLHRIEPVLGLSRPCSEIFALHLGEHVLEISSIERWSRYGLFCNWLISALVISRATNPPQFLLKPAPVRSTKLGMSDTRESDHSTTSHRRSAASPGSRGFLTLIQLLQRPEP